MFDLQGFGQYIFLLALFLGSLLHGAVTDPRLPVSAHPCGAPLPVEAPAPQVDDWSFDPAHPVVAMFYPPIASRHHQEGTTMLSICIMPDGWVGDAVVKKSSGSAQLDAETLISAGTWHFRPAAGGINDVPEWADLGIIYKMPAVAPAALPPALPPASPLPQGTDITVPVYDPAFPHRSAYPNLAIKHGEQGMVLLSFDIEDDGWPSDIQVLQSSGSQQLDAMALVAVGYWHYFPATKAGTRTRGRFKTRVNYRLQ